MKPGVRQVKGTIRKAVYWYLRYVTDQVNALTNVLVRLVRRMDERLGAIEAAVGTGSLDSLIDPVAEAGPEVANAVAEAIPTGGTVFVGAARSGVLVAPIHARGQAVHGVDRDPIAILPGVRDGLDLRSGDPVEHLASSEPGSLTGIVLAGVVEDLGPTAVSSLLGDVTGAGRRWRHRCCDRRPGRPQRGRTRPPDRAWPRPSHLGPPARPGRLRC